MWAGVWCVGELMGGIIVRVVSCDQWVLAWQSYIAILKLLLCCSNDNGLIICIVVLYLSSFFLCI